MKALGIFGTSGHAREIGDIACDLGYRPIYVARSADDISAWAFPEEVILESEAEKRVGMAFVIGVGNNLRRQQISARFPDLTFPTLVHPTATFGQRQRERVFAARGVVVCAGVRLTNNITVGDFVIFNRDVNVGHDSRIGSFSHLAPRACISGNVSVGARCWIGAGAVVNQGTPDRSLVIGEETIVGSGAVVIGDCDAKGVYAGVPARRIR